MVWYYIVTGEEPEERTGLADTIATTDELKSTVRMKPLGNWVGEFDSCTGYHIVCRTTKPIKEP